jgi:acetyltransferase
MSVHNLDFLFRPRSVALAGASDREHSVGATVMRNLIDGRFPGPVYPVHSTRQSVAGVHAYRDFALLPQVADLGVICTPPETVPALVRSLAAQGTRAVAILTDGVDADAVLAAARPHLVRVLGPNSMGLIAAHQHLNASFAPTPARPGPLAFISQSGALLAAALDWAAPRGIGFTYGVSLGDAADVDAADALDFLAGDPATRAVLVYLESVRSGRKFLSAARAAARAKPVIVMKAGRTSAGAVAAMRHTGSQAGDDVVFDAALARAGILRAYSVDELFAAAQTLGRPMRTARAAKLSILTNAGGPGVIAADSASAASVHLAGLPVDLGGDASAADYAAALRSTLAKSSGDAVLVIHGPSGVVAAESVAEACKDDAAASGRVLACFMGAERAGNGASALHTAGVPVYETPERAVLAFAHLRDYRRHQEALQETPDDIATDFAPDEHAVRALLSGALGEGRERLSEPEGKALVSAYGIPVVNTYVARDAAEAARLATQIGYPVALKVLSPDLEHRAEVGGVMLNLENEDELLAAARDIRNRMTRYKPGAQLAGFTVQRMIRPPGAVHRRHGAQESTLRAGRDPVFGMVLRFDAAVGLVPLNAALALDMLGRDDERARAVAAVLVRTSQLLARHPEIAQLEIDPLLVDDKGAMALEVRASVARTNLRPGEHLAIRPYPRELEERLDLKGGAVLLRPIRPGDAGAYAELIARSGAEDLRMRFSTLVRRLPASELARYTQIDYDRQMAFVAVSGSEIVAEVRLFQYPDGETAEFALLVRSDRQRGGLGRALLNKAIGYARARGRRALIGQINPDNQAMLGLARACGMELEQAPGTNLVVAHLDLRPAPSEVKLF